MDGDQTTPDSQQIMLILCGVVGSGKVSSNAMLSFLVLILASLAKIVDFRDGLATLLSQLRTLVSRRIR